MKTPAETSPYALMQEEFRTDPWKLLVACICLNQCSAKVARPVWTNIFDAYPTPGHILISGKEATIHDLSIRLKPLGFQNRRAERIVRMSEEFLSWDGNDPEDLYGIGKYGSDSYNMFVKGELSPDVEDKELKNYLRWAVEKHGKEG